MARRHHFPTLIGSIRVWRPGLVEFDALGLVQIEGQFKAHVCAPSTRWQTMFEPGSAADRQPGDRGAVGHGLIDVEIGLQRSNLYRLSRRWAAMDDADARAALVRIGPDNEARGSRENYLCYEKDRRGVRRAGCCDRA